MKLTLLAAFVSAATLAGCCHSKSDCRTDDCQVCENGNDGCFQHGRPGCCPQHPDGGCVPNGQGDCIPPKEEAPCIPGKVRIRKKETPPPPTAKKKHPIPVAKKTKPKKDVDKVQYTPQSKFGRAKDFSWIVGQLRRVHVNGGSWKLRYAPLDVQDKWGGSVILSQDARIEKFKDGDFVYVEGEILAKRPTVYLAGPLYRISLMRYMTDSDGRKAWSARLQGTAIRR